MKRKLNESEDVQEQEEEEEEVVKKLKPTLDIGDKVSSLKQRLKEQQNELAALQEFNKEAHGEKSKEFVENYLKTSPECKEIFSLFDSDGRPSPEKLCLIWESFESILTVLSNQTEENNFHSIGAFIVSKIIQNHIKTIYSSLSGSGSHQSCKAALRCMTLMLAQGLQGVKEFISSFDFSLKALKAIAKRRDRKQKPDSRTCFVRFCLAFFVFGDVSVIKRILEEKGLASLILNDLHLDSTETIIIVLETLLNHVVNEANVLKKTKLLFFNPMILSKLTHLCKNSNEDIKRIMGDILTILCTDVKYGICFVSSNETPTGKLLNPVLLKFLLSIKQQAVHQDVIFNLTQKTLETCSDIVVPYVNGLNLQMEPRHSDMWYTNAMFIIKLFKVIPFEGSNATKKDLIKLAIPNVISRLQFMTGLKTKVKKVQQLTLDLLEVMLSRCLKLLECHKSLDCDSTKTELVRLLPDVNTVIAIRQVIVSKVPDKIDSAIKTDDSNPKEEMNKEDQLETTNDGLETAIDNDELLKSSIKCLYLYQQLKPGILTESGFNICKLLVFTEADVDENIVMQSLDVLLYEQTGIRAWIEKKISGSENVIQLVLNIIIQCKENKEILKKAKMLFFKILNASGQYDDFVFEIDQWLNSFLQVVNKRSKTDVEVCLFCKQFSECCLKMLNEPFIYVQEILIAVEKYSQLDDASHNLRFPFSPLVVVFVKSLKTTDAIRYMITPVLKLILVSQQNPEILTDVVSKQISEECKGAYKEFFYFCSSWFQAMDIKNDSAKLTSTAFKNKNMEDIPMVEIAGNVLQLTSATDVNESMLTKVTENIQRLQPMLDSEEFDSTVEPITQFLRNIIYALYKCNSISSPSVNKLQEVALKFLKFIITKQGGKVDNMNIAKIIATLPWLQQNQNNAWNMFVEEFYILFLEHCSNFENMELFKKFIYKYLDNSLNQQYEIKEAIRRLSFIEKVILHLNSGVLSDVIQVIVDYILAIDQFPKESDFYNKLSEILSINKCTNTSFEVDHSKMKPFLLHAIKNSSRSCIKLFLSICSIAKVDVSITAKQFKELLLYEDSVFIDVAVYLCNKNHDFLNIFMDECINGKYEPIVLTSLLLPIVIVALKYVNDTNEKSMKFFHHFMMHCWNGLIKSLSSFEESALVPTALQLLLPYASIQSKSSAIEELSQILLHNSIGSISRLDIILSLCSEMIVSFEDGKSKCIFALKLIASCIVQSKHNELHKDCLDYISIFLDITQGTGVMKAKYFKEFTGIWNGFVKKILKDYYHDDKAMLILCDSIKLLYRKKTFRKYNVLKIQDVYQMVISHSKFVEIMFSEDNPPEKTSLVKLIACVVDLYPEVCSKSLVPVMMAAYHVTLSQCDQYILRILQQHERNGIQLSRYYPFVWGSEAYNIYKERSKQNTNLLREQSSSQILVGLDYKQMIRTAVQFPINATIQKNDGFRFASELYDPFFLLPLFATILQPGFQVDCRHFIDSGCLPLSLAALSSHDVTVRKMAYYIISLYSDHLESSRFREKSQVTYFLMLLKNSISEEFMRFPPVWCVFFARYFYHMLRPDQHMYSMLSNCILQKPVINVKELPVFLPLFNSSSLEHSTERAWVLKLLVDGMKDQADFYLYKRYHVFELLMAFHSSQISDKRTKALVLDLLIVTCSIKHAAYDLVKTYSLMSWIHNGFVRSSGEEQSIFLNLLYILMNSFDDEKEDTPVPRLYPHEALLICQSARNQQSLSQQDQIRVCSIFIRLLHAQNHFGDLCKWIHDDDIESVFHVIANLVLDVKKEVSVEIESLFVRFVTYLLGQQQQDANMSPILTKRNVPWKRIYERAVEEKRKNILIVLADVEKRFSNIF